MEIIVGIVIVAFIICFLFSGGSKNSSATRSPSIPKEEKILNENSAWMDERWTLARKERDAGELKTVPHWFFDDVTERQLEKN